MCENADRRGGVRSSYFFPNAAPPQSGSVFARRQHRSLLVAGVARTVGFRSRLGPRPTHPPALPPQQQQHPGELSMLFPVRLTALRRCVRTLSAAARSAAAFRLSRAEPPAPEGLAQRGELARLSGTHGGGRHGQAGQGREGGRGHGDRA